MHRVLETYKRASKGAPALSRALMCGDSAVAISEACPVGLAFNPTPELQPYTSPAALRQVQWEVLVVDEGHRLKNAASRLAEALRGYAVRHRVLLTGTPIQNSLAELWALLNFVLPAVFDCADSFDEWFAAPFRVRARRCRTARLCVRPLLHAVTAASACMEQGSLRHPCWPVRGLVQVPAAMPPGCPAGSGHVGAGASGEILRLPCRVRARTWTTRTRS